MQSTRKMLLLKKMKISQGTMNKKNQVTNAMNFGDISTGMTIVVEDLEVESNSMEIGTIDNDNPSSVLRVIKKAIDTQTIHIKIRLT